MAFFICLLHLQLLLLSLFLLLIFSSSVMFFVIIFILRSIIISISPSIPSSSVHNLLSQQTLPSSLSLALWTPRTPCPTPSACLQADKYFTVHNGWLIRGSCTGSTCNGLKVEEGGEQGEADIPTQMLCCFFRFVFFPVHCLGRVGRSIVRNTTCFTS